MTDNRTTDLKPCPFCGGAPRRVYKSSGQTTHIECRDCRAQFPKSTNENAFDERWNSRHEADVLREIIEDLWPRAAFTMGDANRAGWVERLREAGIEVDKWTS